MKIINVELFQTGDEQVQVRLLTDNRNESVHHVLSIAEITHRIGKSSIEYYGESPRAEHETGQELFSWLDGPHHALTTLLHDVRISGAVIAIRPSHGFSHLPWELMHDGNDFLVNRRPAIVVIRNLGATIARHAQPRPAARALNVLFMAASPVASDPPLDYEQEESIILNATQRRAIELTVEESGNIGELAGILNDHEPGFFDVLHLSGHARLEDGKVVLLTEGPTGEEQSTSADDVAEAIQFQSPQVIFLSACMTGESGAGRKLRSFAEQLVTLGAPAVLAWGKPVGDHDAIRAAGHLYEALGSGKPVAQAFALTCQALIAAKSADWHHLRLFANGAISGPLITKGHKPVRRSVTSRFLDPQHRLRVASREAFIGRRRQIQNCLRALGTTEFNAGVLLYGMGGLGKSTIAARLCERLRQYRPLVFWRQFDEVIFVQQLADNLSTAAQRKEILSGEDELRFRLRQCLGSTDPILFVFDDFEWNLAPAAGRFHVEPHVDDVLQSLLWAIDECAVAHKIIVTSRYDFESDVLRSFYKQALDSFNDVDLAKKLRHLSWLDSRKEDDPLRQRALALADGNPRLLEFLDENLATQDEHPAAHGDPDSLLSAFEKTPVLWKNRVIWDTLYDQLTPELLSILRLCLVFDIAVPLPAFAVACEFVVDGTEALSRAISAGLVEVTPLDTRGVPRYRISRILPKIIPALDTPESVVPPSFAAKSSNILRKEWCVRENRSAAEWHEVFKLALLADPSAQNRRELFRQMLSAQFNDSSDRALEFALWKYSTAIADEYSTADLAAFLISKNWRAADEETAWLLCQRTIIDRASGMGFDELYRKIDSGVLDELDQLWRHHSESRFGFSVQKQMFDTQFRGRDWVGFASHVGWAKDQRWCEYQDVQYTDTAPAGHLPLLPMCRGLWTRGESGPIPIGSIGFCMNLFGYGWRIGGSESAMFGRSTFNY